MYDNGQGVPKNDKTEVKWYTLAAEQGDTKEEKSQSFSME
jgi:TPR repeat protein